MENLIIFTLFIAISGVYHAFGSSDTQSSFSCFVCKSTEDNYSTHCANHVSQTKKFATLCGPNVSRCFARMTSVNDVTRGCVDPMDQDYLNCKGDPFCATCESSLCNKWESMQQSHLICSFCKDDLTNKHSYVEHTCSSGEDDTLQCPLVTMHGRTIYCFTSYSVSSGRVIERGCIEDHRISDSEDVFHVICAENYCNRPQKLDMVSCNSFSGFISKYDAQKGKLRITSCDKNLKSYIHGCYTIIEEKHVRLGCNSQLDMKAVVKWNKSSKAQFCFTENCNIAAVTRCKKLEMGDPKIDWEMCKERDDRCFIRPEPTAPNKFLSGCVRKSLFPNHDPDVHFCTQTNSQRSLPCNDETRLSVNNLACYECSDSRCRDALGSLFKRTCPASATSCYTAEGHGNRIERGCWIPGVTKSEICEENGESCHRCVGNYCNDSPVYINYQSCEHNEEYCLTKSIDPYEEEGFVYYGNEEDLTPQVIRKEDKQPPLKLQKDGGLVEIKEFSCYQCHSQNIQDQSCDEDVRYLEPKPCPYMYGTRPASCYILIHRGWWSMERGCSTALDKYTYATCDTDLFAECKLCDTSGCNDFDMTYVLKITRFH